MSNIIKTVIPFTEDYLPPEIVDRKVETIALKTFLKPIAEGNFQLYNLFVTGGIGAGKTLLTRFVTRELPSSAFYIKMTEGDNTFPKIMFKIISILGLPISAYTPSNIMLMKLVEHLNQAKMGTLLVFDDFDKIPLKAMHPILDDVPRSSHWCNFLFISRIPSVMEGLPPDTKSTLKCRELSLKPYDKETLCEIIEKRAALALNNPSVVKPEIISKIAEMTLLSGNTREAIDLLKTACLISEQLGSNNVSETELEYAIAEIERKSLSETITSLPLYHRLILDTLQRFPLKYHNVYVLWKRKLYQKGLKTLSIYRFRDFVADLKKLDLVNPDIKGEGRGKGFSYYLKLAPSAVPIVQKMKHSSNVATATN